VARLVHSIPSSVKALKSAFTEKASPAVPMPEGADGSTYYRDGTCGTEGAGAVLRASRSVTIVLG
jgi:hypothetical protein